MLTMDADVARIMRLAFATPTAGGAVTKKNR